VTSARDVASDPGTAPAFNPGDYPSSLFGGSDTLAGSPVISLDTGRSLPCSIDSGASLFPDTPYVRWMLRKWFYLISSSNEYYRPSDQLSIPAQIDPFGKKTIVRAAYCDHGSFIFHNVPLGTYIVIVLIYPTYVSHSYAPAISEIPDPQGGLPLLEMGGGTSSTYLLATDDMFFMIANVRFGSPNGTVVIPPTSFKTYAHTVMDANAQKRENARRSK
jgi:hypothetical protein